MSSHKVADGYNNAGTLALLDPQPRQPELVAYAAHDAGGDGHVQPNGYIQTRWVWNSITLTQLASLRTQLGVSITAPSNEVTVSVLNRSGSYFDANAIVAEERIIVKGWFVENYTVLVNRIVAL
jgi:hypothetical protein